MRAKRDSKPLALSPKQLGGLYTKLEKFWGLRSGATAQNLRKLAKIFPAPQQKRKA